MIKTDTFFSTEVFPNRGYAGNWNIDEKWLEYGKQFKYPFKFCGNSFQQLAVLK
jgi:hypothetical protein